ncbi:MAG: Fic family protein [Bacilli bacterium]|nr:Fic family protein [Bacilli bacterium]
MAKHSELFGLLGEYQVLRHQNPKGAKECDHNGQIEFVFECNAIERNSLEFEQVKNVIENGVTTVSMDNREELETAGLNDAMNYVNKLIDDDINLSESIVKELHSILYVGASNDFKGQYRSDFITIPHAQNLPPVRHISYFMNKLFDEYKEMGQLDIIERIALFHIKFENIHPFQDGNGQVGRLIINYQLIRAGYPPIAIKAEDKKAYIKAFEKYNRELDIEPMVEILINALKDELNKRIKCLKVE